MKAKPVSQAKQKMDAEEEALLAAYEDGSLAIGPATSQEKAEARRAATATLKRDKRMNVRMSSMDMIELQTKAPSWACRTKRWSPVCCINNT